MAYSSPILSLTSNARQSKATEECCYFVQPTLQGILTANLIRHAFGAGLRELLL